MNPFKYGQIVIDPDFCPRPQSEKELLEHIKSGQNVLIEGERRIGKSSLIIKTAKNLKTHRVVYIDIYQIKTINDLVGRITNALVSLDDQSGFFNKLIKSITHLQPVLSVDPLSGNPSVSLNAGIKIPPENLENLLDLIYRENNKKKNIVIFDEFQDILNLENKDVILAKLRSKIQFHREMPYIFSGSVRKNMNMIFYDPDSPFFKSAIKIDIGNLDQELFSQYIKNKFQTGKKNVEDSVIELIFKHTNENPGDVQELCNALWSITENNCNINTIDLNNSLETIFSREREFYEHNISLLTNHQFRSLIAIANLGGSSIQSSKFLKQTGISQPSSLKKAVDKLLKLKIIYKYKKEYKFNSPFFKMWIIHKNF